MVEYRTSPAVFDIKYHFVWITKYRYKILRGLAERARDLLRQICQARDAVIVRGAVSPDHIHMLLSCPADIAPAKLVQYLKGRSSRKLQDEFPELRKRYWRQHLWARGYFCASVAPWTRRRSKWTDQIMTEVNRNLAENFGLTDEQVAYRESEIRRHFPEAWVEGHEDLISAMANHPKDRHVLAAAVRCNAEVIVTHNVKDFPRTALEPYSITVMGPSTFLRNLYELDPSLLRTRLSGRLRRSTELPSTCSIDRASTRPVSSVFPDHRPAQSRRIGTMIRNDPQCPENLALFLPFSRNQSPQLNADAYKAGDAQPVEDTS